MTTQGHQWVLNKLRENPHITGQAAIGPEKKHYTQVQRNSCPFILQQHKRKLKVKTKQTYKMCGVVKALWPDHNPPSFKNI